MSNFRTVVGRLATTAAALLAAVPACVSHVAGAESAATGKLDFVAKDFAFDRRTGNVAATDPKQDAVSLYAAEVAADGIPLKPIARVNVGDAPAWIAWKELGDKRFFIVGCLNDPAVYLLAADDLKQVARIPVNGARCVGVAVTESADDPYAYASYYLREGSGEVRKIHLLKHADEGARFGDNYLFAISARGTYAYSTAPGRSWTLLQREAPAGLARPDMRTFVTTRRAHGEIVVNHEETTAAIGENLFSAALDRQIGLLPMEVAAFFAARPIVVGFNGDEFDPKSKVADGPKPLMVFASTNDWKKIDEVEVPPVLLLGRYSEDATTPEDEPYLLGGRPTRVFADDARGRVVAARNDRLTVVKLAGAKPTDEPLLRVEIAGKAEIVAGRKNVIPLRPVDPRVKITLVEPVDDMKITPEGLEWTPAAGAVGERKVAVRLTAGALEKIQIIELRTTRDELTLPFMADGVQLAADGSEAVVWSFPLPPSTSGDPSPNEPFSRVAIVNLHEGKVGAAGVLPHVVRRLAIDASHIYAAADSTLSVIDRTTLKARRKIYLDSAVAALATIEGGKLLVCLADGRRIKYSLPDLRLESDYQAAMPPPKTFVVPDRDRAPPSITTLADGLEFGDGDVFDRSFSRPLFLERIPSFKSINRPPNTSSIQRERLQRTQTYHLSSADKQIIAVTECSEPNAVVALAFVSESGSRFRPSTDQTPILKGYSLEVHPPMGGNVPPQIVPPQIISLSTEAASLTTLRERTPRGRGDFVLHSGVAYCVCGDRLVKARVTTAQGANGRIPAWKRRQSTIVLDRSAGTRLTHSVVAGDSQLAFKLADPTPGLSVEKDGTVVVDGPQLAAYALDFAAGPLVASSPAHPFNPFSSVEEVDWYVAQTGPLFRQIAGRDPQGVPLAVAVQVDATAGPERSARLLYYTLIEIPREQLAERLAAAAARKAAAQAAAADPAQSEEQAKALERRLVALEAELKRLTDEIAKQLEK